MKLCCITLKTSENTRKMVVNSWKKLEHLFYRWNHHRTRDLRVFQRFFGFLSFFSCCLYPERLVHYVFWLENESIHSLKSDHNGCSWGGSLSPNTITVDCSSYQRRYDRRSVVVSFHHPLASVFVSVKFEVSHLSFPDAVALNVSRYFPSSPDVLFHKISCCWGYSR